MPIDEEKEIEFNEWLESIEFIDAEGRVISAVLEEDDSEDPDNDRGEE